MKVSLLHWDSTISTLINTMPASVMLARRESSTRSGKSSVSAGGGLIVRNFVTGDRRTGTQSFRLLQHFGAPPRALLDTTI
jgi:hypothetical protein